jgi:HD superfamily phosphodiesterase
MEEQKIDVHCENQRSRINFPELLDKTFGDQKWYVAFLNDTHHGFAHGEQVRSACLNLLENLTEEERENLDENFESSVLAIEIAALLHDSGRINDNGLNLPEEQKLHHELSAKRAREFCIENNLLDIFPLVEDAIISHDFQSKEITPHLTPPKTMVGKIVQSADQVGWFHPDSVYRTLDFNKAMKVPFFNPNVDLESRINWRPGEVAPDALTVMIGQLFGPTGENRFGIKAAREQIEIYKVGLKKNILKVAEENGVKEEVMGLIQKLDISSS